MVLSTRRSVKRSKMPKEHKQQLRVIDMPLDMLIEIFLLLEPLDLLHLAGTSKVLREFLLSRRKASALWKNVISNVEGFPHCPDHMSAPAYTHLAFVPVCHGCFCPCETVEWELRMRCCPDCFPKMTIPRYSIHDMTETYLNALHLPNAFKHYKLSDVGRTITVDHEIVHFDHSFSPLDWKVVESRKRPRNVSIKEFVAQQNEYWGSIRRHACLCKNWEHGRLKEKAAQLMLVRKQRIEDIKHKLKESGWNISSSSRTNSFLQLPEVSKLEPLTSTEWAKIRPELIGWARKIREDLIGNLCTSTFASICFSIQEELRSDTYLKVQPRGIDIAMLPAVRSVLESDMWESNIGPDTVRDNLKKKFSHILPPAIRKWSSDAVEELERFAREQLCLPSLSKPSCLPSVIFRCKRCSRSAKCRSRFTFDEALSHNHLYREKRSETGGKDPGEMSLYDKVLTKYRAHPRNIRVLEVDVTVSRRVENLIKRMGQNPSKATYDELRRSTVKVVCGLCRPEVATGMNFEGALDHCLNAHVRDNRDTKV